MLVGCAPIMFLWAVPLSKDAVAYVYALRGRTQSAETRRARVYEIVGELHASSTVWTVYASAAAYNCIFFWGIDMWEYRMFMYKMSRANSFYDIVLKYIQSSLKVGWEIRIYTIAHINGEKSACMHPSILEY